MVNRLKCITLFLTCQLSLFIKIPCPITRRTLILHTFFHKQSGSICGLLQILITVTRQECFGTLTSACGHQLLSDCFLTYFLSSQNPMLRDLVDQASISHHSYFSTFQLVLVVSHRPRDQIGSGVT